MMDYPLSLNRCLFSLFDFISGSSSWFVVAPFILSSASLNLCQHQPRCLLPSGPMSYRTFMNSTLHCPAACKNRKSKCEQQRKYFVLYSTVPRDENMKSKSYRTLSPAQSGSNILFGVTEKKHGKYASRLILGCCSIFFLVISCGNHP